MAISQKHVKAIQRQTEDLGELILAINPVYEKEWDAFDKLVSAHKNLRKIDMDALRQLELPLTTKPTEEAKPRKDCPRCAGSGKYRDPSDLDHEPRSCNCGEVEDIAWEKVKKEWEQQLAPAKVE